eukprot:TRINITY_DN42776_c0_g1_i1.p1 TRINITY_DN42776_c0_g1~~TRINITY_DN42776_c0_g1_i1.p1  ORF type:complete len:739 (+),score=274.92 TRINITY_DN42776_c0_g1_i1:89-2305(+)
MKSGVAFIVLFLLAHAQTVQSLKSEDQSKGNPVTRVVNLLKDLGEKLEKEAKVEKKLYDKFVCWGTSLVEEKTKSNEAAQERIQYLEGYIKEIDSGAITFTQEKDEFEEEIAAVTATLEGNKANWTEEHDEFKKEAEETEEGIGGLDTGMDMLENAAAGKSLISLRGSHKKKGRSEKRHRQLVALLRIGQKYLTTADGVFMRDILTGRHHSKGKPKGEVVGEYKSRLGGVIKKLQDVQAQMKVDLEEDTKADKEKQAAYAKRQQIKEDEKKAAEALLGKLEKEYAARDQAKAESKEEIDSLSKQMKEDTSLIDETTAALEEKAKIWEQRSTYRQGEQEAMDKAIELLTSDDARDLFRRSTSFLQVSSSKKVKAAHKVSQQERMMMSARASSAGKELRSVSSKDHRLLILATQLTHVSRSIGASKKKGNPTFDTVLSKIEEMKDAIKKEEETDLQKKEDCETTLTEDTRIAKGHSNKIEDLNSNIAFLTANLKEIDDDLINKDNAIADVNNSLAASKQQRDDEYGEYSSSKSDDEAAVELLGKATKVIEDFYASNPPSFVQMRSDGSQPAGAPKVFEGEYGGAGSQSSGVIGTMKMVEDDLKKEILEADKDEEEAAKMYEDAKKDLEDKKTTLEEAVDTLKIKKGERENDLQTSKKELGEVSELLQTVNKKMKDAEPECKFYLENYDARKKNRLTELNGLDRAKAILNGAEFEDKSRAVSVGDSLVSVKVTPHHHNRFM